MSKSEVSPFGSSALTRIYNISYYSIAVVAFAFAPLEVRRLSETIEGRIRELIVSEKLKAGERLPSERELSRQFGVSTVTVREALRGLEAFGIVRKKRGKDGGIFVSEARTDSVKTLLNSYFSSRDFAASHVSEVRAVIEPGTARLAASRVTPEISDELRRNISSCEKRLAKCSLAPSRKDYRELEDEITEFHRLITRATGNPVLILVIDYLMDFLLESTRKLGQKIDPEITAGTIRDHRRIYECISSGNAAGAERLMLRHLRKTEEYLADKEQSGAG